MKKYNIYQMDEFTPPFKIASFDTKEEADTELDRIQKESITHDMFTYFEIKEERVIFSYDVLMNGSDGSKSVIATFDNEKDAKDYLFCILKEYGFTSHVAFEVVEVANENKKRRRNELV